MYTIILLDDLNGVNYHRVMVPAKNLMKSGYDRIHLVSDLKEMVDMDLSLVSNVVIPRVLGAKNHKVFRKIMKRSNVKIIVDIDDYWVLNKDNFHYKLWKESVTDLIKKTISIADVVWTPSEILKKYINRLNPSAEVVIVPNAIDQEEDQWKLKKTRSKHLRFGYTGAGAHNDDVDEIGYTFEDKVLYCTNVEKYVKKLKASHPVDWSSIFHYGEVYKDIDVLLVPLKKNTFNECKSDLKLVEAAFTGTAVIASNVSPYKEKIINGYNGILCSTPEEWKEAIESMTKKKAKELAANLAKDYVEQREIKKVNEIRINSLERSNAAVVHEGG
jgi:glycosyltransferase involved in cell wall biosynthesis